MYEELVIRFNVPKRLTYIYTAFVEASLDEKGPQVLYDSERGGCPCKCYRIWLLLGKLVNFPYPIIKL